MTRTIGEAIEGRLHEMRIQQKELATVIDVPVSTLNRWLRLGRDIPAQYILKIAHVLRCTPTYLLSGGEEDHEPLTRSDAIEDLIRATVAEVLRQQEAASDAHVVHAKWIPFHSEAAGDIQYCSACEIGFDARMDYCPHCGARMDGWAYDTESQARVAAHTERQRKQLEQIRAEQAAEHDDPIRAMFRRMSEEADRKAKAAAHRMIVTVRRVR